MDFHSILRVLEIVIGIGILVLVHELGHFVAAKWAGVRVDKFALGMGPKIWGVVYGETEYSIRWVPIGGFVAMAGEEPGSQTEASPERQFRNARPGRKAVIIVAGSFMNFVTAIVLFAAALGVGVEFVQPLIGYVDPGSPAERAGLKPGDEIVAVHGDRDVDWADVLGTIAMTGKGDNVTLTVLRDGREFDVCMKPEASDKQGMPIIGIMTASGRVIREIRKGSAAEAAGLCVDDVMEKVDTRTFLMQADLEIYLSSRIGTPVSVVVTRAGKEQTLTLVPSPTKRGFIGVTPEVFPTVGKVADNSPAQAAGIQSGDRIVAIAGLSTPLVRDVLAATSAAAGKPTTFHLQRGDGSLDVTMTPEVMPGEARARVGITLDTPTDFTVGSVEPGSPAAAARICAGDVLTSVDGTSLVDKRWDDVQALLDGALKKGGKVLIERRSGKADFPPVAVEVKAVDDPLLADAGFAVEMGRQKLYRYPLWRAPIVGFKKSFNVVQQVYATLRGILTGSISARHVAGPVGIVGMSFTVTAEGATKFLFWLAILSANFAVVNLLPMPPVDGGLLVYTAIEKVRGKPLSDRVLAIAQTIGWALIAVLVVLITINDIRRLIGLGA